MVLEYAFSGVNRIFPGVRTIFQFPFLLTQVLDFFISFDYGEALIMVIISFDYGDYGEVLC